MTVPSDTTLIVRLADDLDEFLLLVIEVSRLLYFQLPDGLFAEWLSIWT
jgi:hypothetical protein